MGTTGYGGMTPSIGMDIGTGEGVHRHCHCSTLSFATTMHDHAGNNLATPFVVAGEHATKAFYSARLIGNSNFFLFKLVR